MAGALNTSTPVFQAAMLDRFLVTLCQEDFPYIRLLKFERIRIDCSSLCF